MPPESRQYTAINTHLGLYQYKRLTCGVSSAVSIFQRTIENVLKDLPGCCVRIGDIVISGETNEIHLENLHRVLQRLQECGLNPDKFSFMLDDVAYLGTTISAVGISPAGKLLGTAGKVQAIKDAAPPTSISELQSFLGSENFLPKFVPDFAMIASPLYSLLRKETPRKWATPEQDALHFAHALLCTVLQSCTVFRFCSTSLQSYC